MLRTELVKQRYDNKLADMWSFGVLVVIAARDGRRLWEVPESADEGYARYGRDANRRHVKLGLADEVSMIVDSCLVPVEERSSAAALIELVDQLGGEDAEWWARR